MSGVNFCLKDPHYIIKGSLRLCCECTLKNAGYPPEAIANRDRIHWEHTPLFHGMSEEDKEKMDLTDLSSMKMINNAEMYIKPVKNLQH